jgi:hypothetical protein
VDARLKALGIVKNISEMARAERKKTGFSIGNTAKKIEEGLYFTPIRHSFHMVLGGVIVYSESQAIELAKALDGKVDYILVDAEKKIPSEMSLLGEPANVERAVRESVKISRVWIYKGNDLSVEAVDTLLTELTKKRITGIGAAKVAILGAGNLGSKLALKLVERGAQVTITQRKKEKLDVIVKALNYIKPDYTTSSISGTIDNEAAAEGAEILIGATQGIPVITKKMIMNLADKAIILDVGKGTLYPEAISLAEKKNIDIYRLDITAALEGLIAALWATDDIVNTKMGRRKLHNESLVSGGFLGRENEMIVDNVWSPESVYGIADGKGDFVRNPSPEQLSRLENLRNLIE